MVAGKVKLAMGLQKSPKPDSSPKPPSPSSSSSKVPNSQKSRSFGMYFPRASAQVQPRPPDVTELLRMVEELRERESRLKTQLLEHKLLRESVAILPVLEREIAAKDEKIERNVKKIECLEAENEKLRGKLEEEKKKHEEKTKAMEVEIGDLKRMLAEINTTESKRNKEAVERDEISSSQRFQGLDLSAKFNQMRNLKKEFKDFNNGENDDENKKKSNEALEVKRVDDYSVEVELPRHSRCSSEEIVEVSSSSSSSESAATLQSRMPRVPKPPPRPSSTLSSTSSSHSSLSAAADRALTDQSVPPPPPPPPPPRPAPPPATKAAPPPPPPPPPVKGMKPVPAKVRRVPEVVEFYHSLMRRDSRRESGGGANDAPATANPRDMIGEIENRSSHLMAIKTDVETQGDFIRSLIREVENASFADIKDVVPFVKWLDDELSYLVDERAVLKHFDWPEQKADALREAAFGYCDLKKLESEAFTFRDDHRLPCAPALKKMQALFEKLEHGVYNLSRMRESATKRYNGFHIPTDWMLESGYASQIKLTSVKLAMKYMKRVLAELEVVGGSPEEEELIVQGVRFAFRVHQFAGGFDVETMKAFQELREKARSCHIQCQNQHHQKFVCRSTTC